MQLPAQHFGDVLAVLRAAQDSKGHEQRVSSRMDVQAQVKVIPFKDGALAAPFTCMTRDLSFKGVGLLQSRLAEPGSQFVVMLPKPGGASMPVLCTVMYCRALADGIYNVGATFSRKYDFHAAPVANGGNGLGGNAAPVPPDADGRPNADEMSRIRQSILG
jgi:hypothetical protein